MWLVSHRTDEALLPRTLSSSVSPSLSFLNSSGFSAVSVFIFLSLESVMYSVLFFSSENKHSGTTLAGL